MTHIRPFRNADLPALLDVWIQHWSSFAPPPDVNMPRFEQAVLSRTFFDPSSLLVAEQDDTMHGWCHFSSCTRSGPSAVICAICLGTTCEDSLADELLSAVKSQLVAAGVEAVDAGLVRDDTQGYAGLDPIGHGIGIPTTDTRVIALLERHGFHRQLPVLRLTTSTAGYRPPVNRAALQFRRSCRVESQPTTQSDRRRASGMSHLDIETHRLLDRGGAELASVRLWFSDPEAEVMRPSLAILDIAEAHDRQRLEPAESYLIAAVAQGLSERRISTIETAIDADHSELASQLGEIQFEIVEDGARWRLTLG